MGLCWGFKVKVLLLNQTTRNNNTEFTWKTSNWRQITKLEKITRVITQSLTNYNVSLFI